MYTYEATVTRVVDGDTLDLTVDLGFDMAVKIRVRLNGIDTPESRTRDLREKRFGLMATERVRALIPADHKVIARIHLDQQGKFGRYLANILLPCGRDLATLLVLEHLAVPYHGQNRNDIRASHEANWKIFPDYA